MNEKKANHQAVIVRLGKPRVHSGADTLELYDIPNTGYQVVTKKGGFKAGDMGVYIVPDSVVPEIPAFAFLWADTASPVPERKRRITVKKLREEWSEGLLMPLSDFSGGLVHDPEMAYGWLKEGDDVSELLGITHYKPDTEDVTHGPDIFAPKRARRWPKSLKGWFFFLLHKLGLGVNGNHHGYSTEDGLSLPIYDVESLKHFNGVFQEGEAVFVTEKIHGSNGRYVYLNGHMYAGSRTQWKAPDSTCIWRRALTVQPWIEEWCKANEGCTLYGELAPTQPGYQYGSVGPQFFVFDILNPDGTWVPKEHTLRVIPEIWRKLVLVPELFAGEYSEDLSAYATGPSMVTNAKNSREGIVITATKQRYVRGLGRVQLKLVSNSFLEKDNK